MSTIKVNKIENTTTSAGGVAIDSSGHVQVDGVQMPTAGALSNRNLVINGDMRIAQRGTGPVTNTTDGEHLLDRFRGYASSNNTYSIDHSQSTDVPSGQGFKYSYKYKVSANAAATPVNGYVVIGQRIEGYNTDQLHYGTANAKTVTVSFWVKSSEAGTYTVSLRNGNFNFCRTTEFSIQNASTWEFIEITIPGPSTGTWLDGNSTGLEILIAIDTGSDFHNASLDTWASSNNFGSSGATNTWSDTLNNEFYVTGLQLEVGEKATPFEHRSYDDELIRCQRYFQTYPSNSQIFLPDWAGYPRLIWPLVRTLRSTAPQVVGPLDGTSGWSIYGHRDYVVGYNSSQNTARSFPGFTISAEL